MQVAVIEFARHVAGIEGANSSEFDLDSPDPVIALITEWRTGDGETQVRDEASDLGGTMRLGGQLCALRPDSLAAKVYGSTEVTERHRHRFEFNDNYAERLTGAGLVVSARSDAEGLVEMIELPENEHPWFIGCQFHPEYTSTPRDGHPLFTGFIGAALDYQAEAKRRAALPGMGAPPNGPAAGAAGTPAAAVAASAPAATSFGTASSPPAPGGSAGENDTAAAAGVPSGEPAR